MVKKAQLDEDAGTTRHDIRQPPDDNRRPGKLFGPSKQAREHQDRGQADRNRTSSRHRD